MAITPEAEGFVPGWNNELIITRKTVAYRQDLTEEDFIEPKKPLHFTGSGFLAEVDPSSQLSNLICLDFNNLIESLEESSLQSSIAKKPHNRFD